MTAISFSMFKDKILNGEKVQTIRKARKNPIKEGDRMTSITKIPEGLIWQPNCEVYFDGEYIGRVQPNPKFAFQKVIDEFFVWAPGDRAEGIAETKELGMMILYVNWLATSRRLSGEAVECIPGAIA